METKEAIKNRINTLCTEKGITIIELANLSGVRGSTIYSIISGKSNNPSIDTIKKICKGFNISLCEFFDHSNFND